MVFEEGFLKNAVTDDTVYFKDFLAYVYVQLYAKRFQNTSVSSVSVCPVSWAIALRKARISSALLRIAI